MTTTVIVKASGPNYPARVVKHETNRQVDAEPVEDVLIASGFSREFYVGQNHVLSVTEEYHPDGFSFG